MAEVRKVVREDKYGTAKLKKETKEKAKSGKKAVKKVSNNTEEKKSLFTRFRIFCNGVKGEFEKVYKQAIKNKCNYIAVEKQYIKPDSKTLDEFGFEILHENDKLILYKIDLEEVELKEEVKKK